MPKKMNKDGKPIVHSELEGFDIKVNEFGQIQGNLDIDALNQFLDKNVEDKKLLSEEEEE